MTLPSNEDSIDKGSKKAEKKQKKQSVFDKAKEIADKEEKKRKAEADKPKQKPLTEAERKDAKEVAGALGYRVEWVDTMEENGTIDADKKAYLTNLTDTGDDLKYDEEQLKRANEWRAEAELAYDYRQ